MSAAICLGALAAARRSACASAAPMALIRRATSRHVPRCCRPLSASGGAPAPAPAPAPAENSAPIAAAPAAAPAAAGAASAPAAADGAAAGSVREGEGGSEGGGSGRSFSSSSSSSSRAPVSWATLALVTLGGAGAVAYYNISLERAREERRKETRTVGEAAIGGPWSMVDGEGRPVNPASFGPGTHLLLYFGFTFCPDICPNELVKMGKVVDALEAKGLGKRVQPIFVTLDPARDSCEQVQHYVRQFHPRMLGLTGTPGQMAGMAKAFRVYFSDAAWKDKSGDEDDYLVDHSVVIYLMRPDGRLADYFTQLVTSGEIAAKVEKHLRAAAQ